MFSAEVLTEFIEGSSSVEFTLKNRMVVHFRAVFANVYLASVFPPLFFNIFSSWLFNYFNRLKKIYEKKRLYY